MKLSMLTVCGLVFGLLLTSPQKAVSQDSSTASKLEVRVNYTGSGTVDEKHKIYVVAVGLAGFRQRRKHARRDATSLV